MTPNSIADHWFRPTLIAAGAVWVVRAVMALFDPTYWNPRTPFDYVAVIATSTALILTSFGLWGFYRSHPTAASRAANLWRLGILVACLAALTVGISNFIEDALHVSALGTVWIAGTLTFAVGLLIAGNAAFWVRGFSRWVGVWLILIILGLFFTESNGQFVTGSASFALGLMRGSRTKGGKDVQT